MFQVILNAARGPRVPEGPSPARPGLPRWLWVALFAAVLGALSWHETRTSALQSAFFTKLSSRMTWRVEPGPSSRIVFPQSGPYDRRMGYTRIPDFSRTLERRGYRPLEQSRFSPTLETAARLGIPPPYDESQAGGLVVLDAEGDTLYDLTPRAYVFQRYEDIPPIVVSCLLYMENRQLGEPPDTRTNPTVDWGRLGKATLLYAGHRVGLPLRIEGGSTLATQIEKYRHSGGGRTDSPLDKLRQIVAASLKVYRWGGDTREARHAIVMDYLNSMPLAAAPDHGEVHGLGAGLHAWFGMEPGLVARALEEPGATPEKAMALKHVLALLYAVRAPSAYLVHDRDALESRVDNYVSVLADAGVLDAGLARAVQAAPLAFRDAPAPAGQATLGALKPLYTLRAVLARDLGVPSFYDLDRLHLAVESTLDAGLQDSALALFARLRDPAFVASHGLMGEHLLPAGDPSQVVYSLLLYERTPQGNMERVHVDNLDRPFDVNRSMKMELGSTAKLRTVTHYLELVSALYDTLEDAPAGALEGRAAGARDPITRWAATTLVTEPGIGPEEFLERALDRTYSASPYEVFFTGGGTHEFSNFDKADNHRVLAVREAVARSVNLVFIRLMRDLERFHEARLPYDPDRVLGDERDTTRLRMLTEIGDAESRGDLYRAWHDLRGLDPAALEARLLGPRKPTAKKLALVYYTWHPGGDAAGLDAWLRARGQALDPKALGRLAGVYGRLTLSDRAYLLDRNPLEVWCAGVLAQSPTAPWSELLARSAEARRVSSEWLFKPRSRHAQDLRLRIRIEQDAFARMTPYWRRLGFPFDHLVPSLATAIGSSSDRPSALARLMGILLNDGVDRPPVSMSRLAFGPETPYWTVLGASVPAGQRLLPAAVARVVRRTVRGCVEYGTAVRLRGAFVTAQHDTLAVGGKTGSGDNRFDTFGPGGRLIASRPVNRTAAFVFYVGERYYGVLTASVDGPRSGDYVFTSSLPVAVLRMLAPTILDRFSMPASPPVAAQDTSQAKVLSARPVSGPARPATAGVSMAAPRRTPAQAL